MIVGGIYWLIHKVKGELTERNKYRRSKLFGFLLLLIFVFSIISFAILYPTGFYTSTLAARRVMWLFISVSVGWYWMRTVWTPFEKIQSETDAPVGLGQAISQWKKSASKSLGLDKPKEPKKKPYEYVQPAASDNDDDASISKNAEQINNKDDVVEKLEKYRDLYEKGLISEDEYSLLKSKELGM
tara:strand:+ start:73 stop:627 length:555 start_codon:yes stop_codon:yes gene_type:complete